ncbi:MAG TPA: glycosyl hydrolase [Solirubrobacter sp.]|nr:glycosyl hydrolase [Solirubrobacter sp.]
MRLALAIVLALVLATPAAAATRPPLIGVGEQNVSVFTDPAFESLGLRDVRFVAAYDALHSDWQRQELDDYLTAARGAGVRVLLGFGHSRDPEKMHTLPSVARFEREFKAFRARYPWIKDYLTWNEANHCSQPTCRNPARAAKFYLALRKHCRGCRIVAADVLDGTKMVGWVRRFQKAVGKNRRVIWGIHNYIDANRFRTRGTKALLAAVKGDVWFTETGGIVRRDNHSSLSLPQSPRHAAQATTWVFKLAALSSRVKRVYFYHWSAPPLQATWDSAFVDRKDKPRPAYTVLRKWLRKHAR